MRALRMRKTACVYADKGDYGRALYAVLESEWDRQQTTRGAWCLKHGMHATTVKRWGEGSDPDLTTLRQVSEALGEPMLNLLITIGVLSPAEAGQREVTVADAIKRSDLPADRKRALNTVLSAFDRIDAGADVVRGSTARGNDAAKTRRKN